MKCSIALYFENIARKFKLLRMRNVPDKVEVKINFTIGQTTKAQRGSTDISLLFL